MRFSVIIPAYNEALWIRQPLDALMKQTFDDFEIIVVYGGSDDTPDIAREYTNKVYKEPPSTRGPAAARNYGAKKAKGEIVIFTDADTIPNKRWLESYDGCFKPDVVGSGGPVYADSKNVYYRFIYWLDQDFFYRVSSAFGFHQFSGNNCAYRKREFLSIGGFNEKTSMLEDVELAMRMRKVGKEAFCPGAWVKTSARRFETEGYWHIFFKNLKGYWGLWTKGRAEVDYFTDWEREMRGKLSGKSKDLGKRDKSRVSKVSRARSNRGKKHTRLTKH